MKRDVQSNGQLLQLVKTVAGTCEEGDTNNGGS